MRRITKVGLLLAAIVAIHSVAAAGNLTVTPQMHSSEGLNGVTANQTSNTVYYTLGAAYAWGDTITFTFPSSGIVSGSWPSLISAPAVDSATPENAIAGLELGLLNSDTSSVTYRVTRISQPDDTPGAGGTPYLDRTTLGAQVTLGSIGYAAAAVAAADVTITVSSQTITGEVLDSAGTLTATLAQAKSQFARTATISPVFNKVIDITAARKAFTTAGPDTLTWSVTPPDTTGWLNLATINPSGGTSVTLDGEAGKMTGLQVTDFTGSAGTLSFIEASSRLTLALAGQVNSGTITFTPRTDGTEPYLETQSFTLNLVRNYTSAASVAGATAIATYLNAGAWKLNSTKAIIGYMPYSANASQVIYVSNMSTLAGAISAEAIDQTGRLWVLGVVGQAPGRRVTKIAPAIWTALQREGFTAGKVALKIEINAPDSYVHASYNAGSVPGYVEVEQFVP